MATRGVVVVVVFVVGGRVAVLDVLVHGVGPWVGFSILLAHPGQLLVPFHPAEFLFQRFEVFANHVALSFRYVDEKE